MGPVCIAFESGGWNRCPLKAISMTRLDAVRARFARNEGLPFADILTEASILDVLNEHDAQFRDRVFSPVTTIWGFLSQVLSEDHSCTVMAVAANENDIEPRQVSFKGAKQALTAFAPKIEAARPEDRAPLIDAMLTTIAYHRVGDRPGRWEPRARKRRPKPAAPLTQPRKIAKLQHNRSKWF
jgi:hypothetical protein